jgi:hypothetical protein
METTTTDGAPPIGDPEMSDADREAAEAFNAEPDRDPPSIADIAESGEPVDEDDGGQQFLDFGDRVDLRLKGKKPSDSELKIKAVSRPITGQLGDQGDDETVTFLVRGRLDKVEVQSKRDGDGRVTAKVRRHHLTPITITPIRDDAVAERVSDLVHGEDR